jgi:hypothetical protein
MLMGSTQRKEADAAMHMCCEQEASMLCVHDAGNSMCAPVVLATDLPAPCWLLCCRRGHRAV